MVIDRVLKVNYWVLYIEKEKEVDLGNHYLEWYWDQYLELNWGNTEIRSRS